VIWGQEKEGYLRKEGSKRIAAAHTGVLPKPHCCLCVPLVRVTDPPPEFQCESHSRSHAALWTDPLLTALGIATKKLFNRQLARLQSLDAPTRRVHA
jgi:hypothetical protein